MPLNKHTNFDINVPMDHNNFHLVFEIGLSAPFFALVIFTTSAHSNFNSTLIKKWEIFIFHVDERDSRLFLNKLIVVDECSFLHLMELRLPLRCYTCTTRYRCLKRVFV